MNIIFRITSLETVELVDEKKGMRVGCRLAPTAWTLSMRCL